MTLTLINKLNKVPDAYISVDIMVASGVLLSDEDRALLMRVSSLLEELLETLDVLEDKEAVRSIREAEEDVSWEG